MHDFFHRVSYDLAMFAIFFLRLTNQRFRHDDHLLENITYDFKLNLEFSWIFQLTVLQQVNPALT